MYRIVVFTTDQIETLAEASLQPSALYVALPFDTTVQTSMRYVLHDLERLGYRWSFFFDYPFTRSEVARFMKQTKLENRSCTTMFVEESR